MSLSQAERLASLSEADRAVVLAGFTEEQFRELEYDWRFWGRPEQFLPDGDWLTFLVIAGRGFGKTRLAVEGLREEVMAGRARQIAIVAETAADARDVIVEGPAGILKCHPPKDRPIYEPSKRRLTWPNGATASLFNATEPDQLRGPQFDFAYCDESAKWQYAQETWDQLQFALRLGRRPRQIVTTTPRPIQLLRTLIKAPTTITVRGSTFDNKSNLAQNFLDTIEDRYSGTRLGRQELYAEILEDMPGALWSRDRIDALRIKPEQAPEFKRVVVAIDPSVSNEERSDETGIICAALGEDGHGYILDDVSGKYAPIDWAKKAAGLCRSRMADRVVAEVNQGGDLVEATLRSADANVPYRKVHATRGKAVRAEPVSALYEQCVAKGTLIACESGQVPIEAVRCGDMVWTREGLRRVLWAGQTGVRETIEIRLNDRSLRLTNNHPVLTEDGWVNAGQLASKERIAYAWVSNAKFVKKKLARPVRQRCFAGLVGPCGGGEKILVRLSGRLLSLTGLITTSSLTAIGGRLAMAGMNCSTEQYGASITRCQSRTDGTSITKMGIPVTTTLRTWSQWIRGIMRTITIRTDSHLLAKNVLAPSVNKDSLLPGVGSLFARTNAVALVTPAKKDVGEPVFNLHVEGVHEYVANGILVHNCKVHHVGSFPALEDQMCLFSSDLDRKANGSPDRVDALVWALTDLMVGKGRSVLHWG
jgi:phage terminase large subunit-like protein